ncbi:MAG: FxsA family protein [Myxococcales bacterium]|nr:FxsA family protein [Myxococcales bacterium]
MLGKLLLLFTVVPVVELYLLITLGQHLGAEATIGLVLVTGLLGASLARREGARVLRNWQASMARGELPKEGVTSSLLVLVGGVLLVTPGVVTDVTGLLLLVPWSRRWVAEVVRRRLEHRLHVHTLAPDPEAFMGPGARPRGTVIDVDAVEAEPAERSA